MPCKCFEISTSTGINAYITIYCLTSFTMYALTVSIISVYIFTGGKLRRI